MYNYISKNKNGLYGILTFLGCIFSVFACTERIEVSTKDAPERLVIYGYITTDTTQHSIRITRSSGYFTTSAPEGISNANVTISSGKGSYLLSESKETPGLYQTEPGIFGIEGETYTLNVKLDFDEDGETEEFEAVSYLPVSGELDSIGFKQSDVFDDVIEILLYGRIPEDGKNYFSFHAYRNHDIVNDSLVGFFILDDEYLEKREFFGLPCFYLDQDDKRSKIESGDSITLRVDFLTEEYADFLDNARMEVEENNPIFNGPPANVETNIKIIHNPSDIPIAGFFSAYSGNSVSKFY